MSGSKKKILYSILFIFIAIFCLVVIMPFFIMVTTAFKSSKELTLANFRIFPEKLLFSNFSEAMRKGDWVRYFVNSTIVTVITVAASLFFNSLAGYSLARLKFKGRQLILIIFIIGIMIPPQSCLIPQFIILKSFPLAGGNDIWGKGGIGLLNSYAGLIIPFVSGSFGVFLCRQFYLSFPRDLDDAATIDGCSKFMTYIRIYLPLSGSLLSTLTILQFVATWNDFLYPLVITNDVKMYTVQLGLQTFRGVAGVEWNLLMAGTLMTILPIMIVFVFAQKNFVRGIATTGLKG